MRPQHRRVSRIEINVETIRGQFLSDALDKGVECFTAEEYECALDVNCWVSSDPWKEAVSLSICRLPKIYLVANPIPLLNVLDYCS